MKIFLLETMPLASILGIITTILITIIGFLAKDAYSKVLERVHNLEEEVKQLREGISDVKTSMEKEMRAVDNRMGDLKLNILEKLDTIKNQFNEFRK